MRARLGYLLPILLMCSPASYANNEVVGDYWLLHQQGTLHHNAMFVADADPAHIVPRGNNVRSVGVYALFESASQPDLTSYDVEVDCGRNRVRIVKADDYSDGLGFSPAKFASGWQGKPETWLAQTRDFFCRPAEREEKQMVALGTMPLQGLLNQSITLFKVRGREQSIDLILKAIDLEFDKMPRLPSEGTP